MWTLFVNNFKHHSTGEMAEQEDSDYFSLLAKVLCENPAKIIGVDSKKGSLEIGKQADLLVFDPSVSISIEDKHIKNRYPEVCIYRGKILQGIVEETYLRGEHIFSYSNSAIEKSKFIGNVLNKKDFIL